MKFFLRLFSFTLISTGCQLSTGLNSQEVIEKDILQYMSEKYGEEFLVKSISNEANVSSGITNKHFVKLSPKRLPAIIFSAKVSYENEAKSFEIIFEQYPQTLMGLAANESSKKVIDNYLENYHSKTTMINSIKLEEGVYPNEKHSYEEIVAMAPNKWQTNLTIETSEPIVSKSLIDELFIALVQDHKIRNHGLLNIHFKELNNDGTYGNHVLKIDHIQDLDLIADKNSVLSKIMRF